MSNSKFFVENIPRYYEDPAMPGMGCYAGLQEIHLYPDGSISGCCFLKGTDSVRTRSLKELLASEAFKDILRKTRAKKCPHCWSPPVHEYNLLVSPKALFSGFKLAKTYLRWSRR